VHRKFGEVPEEGKGVTLCLACFSGNFLGALASGMNQPIFISQKTVQPEQ